MSTGTVDLRWQHLDLRKSARAQTSPGTVRRIEHWLLQINGSKTRSQARPHARTKISKPLLPPAAPVGLKNTHHALLGSPEMVVADQ
jgi:hypothetical protein